MWPNLEPHLRRSAACVDPLLCLCAGSDSPKEAVKRSKQRGAAGGSVKARSQAGGSSDDEGEEGGSSGGEEQEEESEGYQEASGERAVCSGNACEPSTTGPCYALPAGGCMCGEEHLDTSRQWGQAAASTHHSVRWLTHACRL